MGFFSSLFGKREPEPAPPAEDPADSIDSPGNTPMRPSATASFGTVDGQSPACSYRSAYPLASMPYGCQARSWRYNKVFCPFWLSAEVLAAAGYTAALSVSDILCKNLPAPSYL